MLKLLRNNRNTFILLSSALAIIPNLANAVACDQSRPPVQPDPVAHQPKCPNMSVGLKSTIWPNADIPVCWEDSASAYPKERKIVQDGIKATWEKYSALNFTDWNTCNGDRTGIRIGIADINPHTKGVGTQIRGDENGMMLNFTFDDWSPDCRKNRRQKEYCIRTIAVHEFGHALGLTHEHNREDTPRTGAFKCDMEPQGTVGDINITEYDKNSVMNYCNEKWSGDGKLSRDDITGLQTWYGKPNAPCDRYAGKWIAKLKYSDITCVADDIVLNVSNNVVTGSVKTPFGLEVPIKATIDNESRLSGLRFRFSDKDEVTLTGVLGKGRIHSTDCGCGEYQFVKQ